MASPGPPGAAPSPQPASDASPAPPPPPPSGAADSELIGNESREDLQKKYKEQQAALERSEKVRVQLRQVAEALQKKVTDLEAQVVVASQSQAAPPNASTTSSASDTDSQLVQCSLAALKERVQELEERQANEKQLREKAESALHELRLSSQKELDALRGSLGAAEAALAKAVEEAALKEVEWNESYSTLENRLRCMVAVELLQQTEAENKRLSSELSSTQDECQKLRAALADNWAKGADAMQQAASHSTQHDSDLSNGTNSVQELVRLNALQEELESLASLQKQSSCEVSRIQQLERTNASLEQKLQQLAEKNAELRSRDIDLEDEGQAMREVLVSQNEQFIQKIDDLTEERKSIKADREKLLNECVTMQGEVEHLRKREKELLGFEGLNRRLEGERQALSAEVERLRATNTALCAQVFGEELANDDTDAMQMMRGMKPMGADGANVAEDSMQMVLKLQKRLTEREEAHWQERQKLQERLQEMERANMRQGANSLGSGGTKAPAAQAAASNGRGGRSWVATLGGGIGRPARPEPEPQGADRVIAQVKGGLSSGLNTMRDWLP